MIMTMRCRCWKILEKPLWYVNFVFIFYFDCLIEMIIGLTNKLLFFSEI